MNKSETLQKCRELLGSGDTEAAIDLLLTQKLDSKGEILHLSGWIKDLQKKQRLGLISENALTEQLNQIRYAVNTFIINAENNNFSKQEIGSSTSKKSTPKRLAYISSFAILIVFAALAFVYFNRDNGTSENNHLNAPISEVTKQSDSTESDLIKDKEGDTPNVNQSEQKIHEDKTSKKEFEKSANHKVEREVKPKKEKESISKNDLKIPETSEKGNAQFAEKTSKERIFSESSDSRLAHGENIIDEGQDLKKGIDEIVESIQLDWYSIFGYQSLSETLLDIENETINPNDYLWVFKKGLEEVEKEYGKDNLKYKAILEAKEKLFSK